MSKSTRTLSSRAKTLTARNFKAGSTGQHKQLCQSLTWLAPLEGLARAVVEHSFGFSQIGTAVHTEVCNLGEELA
jgi:hypothetical protein